jgi:hypothetical protein
LSRRRTFLRFGSPAFPFPPGSFGGGAARSAPVVGIEEPLAQPDRFRGHLDQFVIGDVGDGLFETE